MADKREEKVEKQMAAVQRYVSGFDELVVEDAESYEVAGEFLVECRRRRKEVEEFFEPMRAATWAAYQSVIKPMKEADRMFASAERVLKDGRSAFEAEQEQKRLAAVAEQERLERERMRREIEAQVRAEQAAEKGEEPPPPPPEPEPKAPVVEVPPPLPETKGVSTRKVWVGEVTDVRLLCKAIADGMVDASCVKVSQSAVNRLAESLGGTMEIPGVRFYTERRTSLHTR